MFPENGAQHGGAYGVGCDSLGENAGNGSSPRVTRHAENIFVPCASLATLIGKFLNLLILIE